MTIQYGVPTWTTGGFTRRSGLDDLGLEGVGAGMLRRFLPGIVQTTPNAGYYSFYPYLLARWQDKDGSIASSDLKPWFRRQDVAFVAACALHEHEDDLGGVVGISAIREALVDNPHEVDLARLAQQGGPGYLKAALGGFSMYYGAVLRDLRLTMEGLGARVDRVTDHGRRVAEAFAESFEATEYFRRFTESDVVPTEVLAELGASVCLCQIPGRTDHEPLLDTFIGEPLDKPKWESLRRTRVASFALFLEFHDQRPDDVDGSLKTWRMALASQRFPDGSPWDTRFPAVRESWRAYQVREAEMIALLGLWVSFLMQLHAVEPAPQRLVRDHLVEISNWRPYGLEDRTPTGDALTALADSVATPEELIELATTLERPRYTEPHDYLVNCVRVLAKCTDLASSQAEGFRELVDEGGSGRWSLQYLSDWLSHRSSQTIASTLAELIDALVHQHQTVALGKVRPTGKRDPFCIAEDNGLLSVIRDDDPLWSGGRFSTVNHLLWTLGLLDGPDGYARPTPLGNDILNKVSAHA